MNICRMLPVILLLTLHPTAASSAAVNELGIGAGCTFYMIGPGGPQFYFNPVSARFDHSFTPLIWLRCEAGWSQFRMKSAGIKEGYLNGSDSNR